MLNPSASFDLESTQKKTLVATPDQAKEPYATKAEFRSISNCMSIKQVGVTRRSAFGG